MRIVRNGITRTVILTRSWAVKVPSLRGGCRGPRAFLWSLTAGIQANLSEQEWSGTAGTCPVRWSLLGLVSVYPRCGPVLDGADVDYAGTGWPFDLDRMDCKPDNVGYLAGRLVWLDYDQSNYRCVSCRPPNRDPAGADRT